MFEMKNYLRRIFLISSTLISFDLTSTKAAIDMDLTLTHIESDERSIYVYSPNETPVFWKRESSGKTFLVLKDHTIDSRSRIDSKASGLLGLFLNDSKTKVSRNSIVPGQEGVTGYSLATIESDRSGSNYLRLVWDQVIPVEVTEKDKYGIEQKKKIGEVHSQNDLRAQLESHPDGGREIFQFSEAGLNQYYQNLSRKFRTELPLAINPTIKSQGYQVDPVSVEVSVGAPTSSKSSSFDTSDRGRISLIKINLGNTNGSRLEILYPPLKIKASFRLVPVE